MDWLKLKAALLSRGTAKVSGESLEGYIAGSTAGPGAERLLCLCRMEEKILSRSGLDIRKAQTMCIACTGCDLVPGRDT